jgi:16S rRNA (guanine966-N2)-methyltransferase
VTRIISGTARGRRVAVPPGGATRPTSDRAREGLFNTLGSLVELRGARFADLYAGSGAVGFEAASRGAAHVLLVDSRNAVTRTLRANAAALGFAAVEIVTDAVERVVENTPPRPYDVLFLDPPYALEGDAVTDVLDRLLARGWLSTDGVCVVERSRRSGPLIWPEGITPIRDRSYGEGVLWYGSGS